MFSLRFFWPGPEASEQQTPHRFLTEDFGGCLTDREVLVLLLNLYPRVSTTFYFYLIAYLSSYQEKAINSLYELA